MKKQIPSAGFTLVEILIVIGVMGVLIAGLLAAIDPIEQINRAQDTSKKSVASELLGAFNRYYATHGDLPWEATDCEGTDDYAAAGGLSVTSASPCVDELETDGELKEGFVAGLGSKADDLIVQSDSATNVSICFLPDSKAIYNEPDTKYDVNADVNATDCQPATGSKTANSCYWCAR